MKQGGLVIEPNLAVNARRWLAKAARGTPPFRGKTRLLRLADTALRETVPAADAASLDERLGDVVYRLDTRDIIDFNLLYAGLHEEPLVHFVISRLQSRPSVLWDVGANVGSVCLPLAAALPQLTIDAFEPSPTVRPRLEQNLELNQSIRHRIRLHSCALSDQNGSSEFYVSNEVHNSGVGGLGQAGNRSAQASLVSVMRGDDLIERGELAAPDFIKIDVEGYEPEVLHGLERYLRQDRKIELVMENEPYRFRERGQDPDLVVRYLRELNFELFVIAAPPSGGLPKLEPLQPSHLEEHCDVYARSSRVERG